MATEHDRELKELLSKTSQLTFEELAAFKSQLIEVSSLTEHDPETKKMWLEMAAEVEHYEVEIKDLHEEFCDRLKRFLSN